MRDKRDKNYIKKLEKAYMTESHRTEGDIIVEFDKVKSKRLLSPHADFGTKLERLDDAIIKPANKTITTSGNMKTEYYTNFCHRHITKIAHEIKPSISDEEWNVFATNRTQRHSFIKDKTQKDKEKLRRARGDPATRERTLVKGGIYVPIEDKPNKLLRKPKMSLSFTKILNLATMSVGEIERLKSGTIVYIPYIDNPYFSNMRAELQRKERIKLKLELRMCSYVINQRFSMDRITIILEEKTPQQMDRKIVLRPSTNKYNRWSADAREIIGISSLVKIMRSRSYYFE